MIAPHGSRWASCLSLAYSHLRAGAHPRVASVEKKTLNDLVGKTRFGGYAGIFNLSHQSTATVHQIDRKVEAIFLKVFTNRWHRSRKFQKGNFAQRKWKSKVKQTQKKEMNVKNRLFNLCMCMLVCVC